MLRINIWNSLQIKWSSCLLLRLGYLVYGHRCFLIIKTPRPLLYFHHFKRNSKNTRHLFFLNLLWLFKVCENFESPIGTQTRKIPRTLGRSQKNQKFLSSSPFSMISLFLSLAFCSLNYQLWQELLCMQCLSYEVWSPLFLEVF